MADIKDLSAALKVLAHNGTIFDIEQRFQLENSLQELLNKSVLKTSMNLYSGDASVEFKLTTT